MNAIPYEESSFYSFDRGYNDFKRITLGKYPNKIRRVIYCDEENKRKLIFSTDVFAEDERLDISPMMVAELYHNRWQIELLFKWLKQHFKIKKSGAMPRMT